MQQKSVIGPAYLSAVAVPRCLGYRIAHWPFSMLGFSLSHFVPEDFCEILVRVSRLPDFVAVDGGENACVEILPHNRKF